MYGLYIYQKNLGQVNKTIWGQVNKWINIFISELEGTLQRVARAAVTSDNVRRLILDTMTKLYEDGASTTQLGEAMLKFIYLLKGAELGYMKETKPTEPEGPEVEGITAPQNGTNSNATETEDLTNSTTPDASLMPTPMPDESMISATSTVIVMATSVNSMAGLAISPSTSLVEMPSSENLMENSNSSSGNTTGTEFKRKFIIISSKGALETPLWLLSSNI